MPKYKAIIFDLGKVIFDLSFDITFQSWATSSSQQLNDIRNRFVFSELFNKFETDEITPVQFRSGISKQLNVKLTDEEFDKGWCSLYLDVYTGIDNFLLDLKQHYRLVALTNTNCIHHQVWKEKYAHILQHFEKIFSSHEINARKPDSQAYQIVLDYLNVKSEQAIFLDDNIENVNGANLLGIKTILVTSPQQMIDELTVLLRSH